MRKLLTLATIFACMFTFAGCNDDEEKEEQEVKEKVETTYTIHNKSSFETNYKDVYIYEIDKYGDIVEKKFFDRIMRGETLTITANSNTVRIISYAISLPVNITSTYYYYSSMPLYDGDNSYNLYGEQISQTEYLQGIQQ